MTRICVRAIQLLVLTGLVLGVTAKPAPANEFGCYAICIYDDWQCILSTGHPADSCSYDRDNDICTLGGCQLPSAAQAQ